MAFRSTGWFKNAAYRLPSTCENCCLLGHTKHVGAAVTEQVAQQRHVVPFIRLSQIGHLDRSITPVVDYPHSDAVLVRDDSTSKAVTLNHRLPRQTLAFEEANYLPYVLWDFH